MGHITEENLHLWQGPGYLIGGFSFLPINWGTAVIMGSWEEYQIPRYGWELSEGAGANADYLAAPQRCRFSRHLHFSKQHQVVFSDSPKRPLGDHLLSVMLTTLAPQIHDSCCLLFSEPHPWCFKYHWQIGSFLPPMPDSFPGKPFAISNGSCPGTPISWASSPPEDGPRAEPWHPFRADLLLLNPFFLPLQI